MGSSGLCPSDPDPFRGLRVGGPRSSTRRVWQPPRLFRLTVIHALPSTTQALISVYAVRMAAVFTLSVSTPGLRTSAIPCWVCYLGYLVAAVLLLVAGEDRWTQLLFPAWVLLVSIVILFTRPQGRAATPNSPPTA